jgi:hypothetical protein
MDFQIYLFQMLVDFAVSMWHSWPPSALQMSSLSSFLSSMPCPACLSLHSQLCCPFSQLELWREWRMREILQPHLPWLESSLTFLFQEERFYFGDNVLPCFESGIPLLKHRIHQLPDSSNVSIAFPDEGAWKRFNKQLQHFPTVCPMSIQQSFKVMFELVVLEP